MEKITVETKVAEEFLKGLVREETSDPNKKEVSKDKTNSSNKNQKEAEVEQTTNITKYYILRKLIDLFLESEQGEKAEGRKVILWCSVILIYAILIFEVILIIAQGLGWIKLDVVVFLGTIGTITSGAVFILKTVTKSLYNDESDKILKTVEKIAEKL